ncbi:MAG: amino acid--tRNA ligase-related protein [bacterium]|nr:amino acid--tRNA ligase-related protein [bacterium]
MSVANRINAKEYDFAAHILRSFFRGKEFLEVPTQHYLSILAACEDPATVAPFIYKGQVWPLPQTGQMQLEYELLTNPDVPGFYCISTSFRNEPDPVPGRHDLIFPMFEFETHGGIETLFQLEKDLLIFLGFGPFESFYRGLYADIAKDYNTRELTADHEEHLWREFGPVFFLTHFPLYTSPFWNMKKIGEYANKIDVILYGMETIGSAERSTNPDEMREQFYTISNGMYSRMLFSQFTKERVVEELEAFLALPMIPRCGGGIGLTRMIRALKLAGILCS